jgi:hypothetical protein
MGFEYLRRAAVVAGAAVALTSTAAVQSIQAQAVVRGTLYDDASGAPLRGTVMLIDPATDAPVVYKATDSLGQFSLETQRGVYRIAAIHPGYKSILSAPVTLQNKERLTVRVPIAAAGDPTHRIGVLEHVHGDSVSAPVMRAAGLDNGRYETRKALGTGLHYDRAQMERSSVTTLGEFLQTVPGMSVTDPRQTSSVQLMRNAAMSSGSVPGVAASSCHLGWFVDGVRIDIPGTSDPMPEGLGTMQLEDLTAVEIFRGLSEMPPEFATPDHRCGAVAIWTRRE